MFKSLYSPELFKALMLMLRSWPQYQLLPPTQVPADVKDHMRYKKKNITRTKHQKIITSKLSFLMRCRKITSELLQCLLSKWTSASSGHCRCSLQTGCVCLCSRCWRLSLLVVGGRDSFRPSNSGEEVGEAHHFLVNYPVNISQSCRFASR